VIVSTSRAEWTDTTIGDVIDIFDYKRIPLRGSVRKQRQGLYPYYGASGVIDHIDEYIFNGRYLLIAEDGENLNSRKLPVAFFAEGKFWVNNHAHIVRAKPGAADDHFLFSWFAQANISGYITGAAQPKLSQENLKRIELRLPPLPAQRKIAAILSAYDDLIENNLRRIKILEEMAQNLYREWFVKFRFPGHQRARFTNSLLGQIPEGWEVKRLGDLISEHIGGGWGNDIEDDKHSESAWVIRGTDIPDARSCNFSKVPFRHHTKSNLKSRRLIPGDIVFEVSGGSKGQLVGRSLYISSELLAAFNGDPVICASFCKRIQPNSEEYASELLYLSFLAAYESGEIEQYQVQSTGISNYKWLAYLEKVSRCVPPIALQGRFRELSAPLFSEIATLGRKNTALRRTRGLLLPRLISGKLDVSELDIAIPEEAGV
jgi:type I restriction enzyme S subunit